MKFSWLSIRAVLIRTGKILGWTLVGLVSLSLVECGVEQYYPASFETRPATLAWNFVCHNRTTDDLPDTVDIEIDGVRAVFHRGSDSYARFAQQLNRCYDLWLAAHNRTRLVHRQQCGELGVHCFGIMWHYMIVRSIDDPNFYWIWIPKLTSPGARLVPFLADSDFLEFIRSNAIRR